MSKTSMWIIGAILVIAFAVLLISRQGNSGDRFIYYSASPANTAK